MKPTERPLLFNAPMVRATLDDSKTQTRRVAKLTDSGHVKEPRGHRRWHPADPEARLACPYGQPGDRLWVRETFVQGYPYDAVTDRLLQCDAVGNNLPMKTWYRADKSDIGWSGDDGFQVAVPWKPSIHMPRAASRILLEIVSVRIERLQDISEADAIAEGCTKTHNGYYWGGHHKTVGRKQLASATGAYRDLWESINGTGSWDLNPWVWVVEFNRVSGT